MSSGANLRSKILTLLANNDFSPTTVWNCFGLLSREYGHSLVPWPPAVTIIFIWCPYDLTSW
jgi:hypothetical protein